jgi:hypothetical protein
VLLCVLAVPQLASAKAMRLYDSLDRQGISDEVRERVRAMAETCEEGSMSRIGPSPKERARCEANQRKVMALGPTAARAALAYVDDAKFGARYSLYDVIARNGGVELVEPMVRALEAEAGESTDNVRHYEVGMIARTLSVITYAAPKGTPSIQWRKWADAHRGVERSALLRERLRQANEEVNSPELATRIEAAAFLAEQDGSRGLGKRVLDELSARKDLDPDMRRLIDDKLYWIAARAQLTKKQQQDKPPMIVAVPES